MVQSIKIYNICNNRAPKPGRRNAGAPRNEKMKYGIYKR